MSSYRAHVRTGPLFYSRELFLDRDLFWEEPTHTREDRGRAPGSVYLTYGPGNSAAIVVREPHRKDTFETSNLPSKSCVCTVVALNTVTNHFDKLSYP
jgi:hypothetical protein